MHEREERNATTVPSRPHNDAKSSSAFPICGNLKRRNLLVLDEPLKERRVLQRTLLDEFFVLFAGTRVDGFEFFVGERRGFGVIASVQKDDAKVVLCCIVEHGLEDA